MSKTLGEDAFQRRFRPLAMAIRCVIAAARAGRRSADRCRHRGTGDGRERRGIAGGDGHRRSSALQVGELVAVTDGRGEYRLTPLPMAPTRWCSRSPDSSRPPRGAAAVGRLRRAGQRADARRRLEESITVSGVTPIVDVTSTSASTFLTRETLELTPTSRNGIISLLAQVPSVRANLDVGGGTLGDPPTYRLHGMEAESWVTLENVITTDSRHGGNYFNYAAFDEARVQSSSNEADVPSRGVAVTMVTKSGGDTFRGGGLAGYMSRHLQSNNIDSELAPRGSPAVTRCCPRPTRAAISAAASSNSGCGSTAPPATGPRTGRCSRRSDRTARRATRIRARTSSTARSGAAEPVEPSDWLRALGAEIHPLRGRTVQRVGIGQRSLLSAAALTGQQDRVGDGAQESGDIGAVRQLAVDGSGQHREHVADGADLHRRCPRRRPAGDLRPGDAIQHRHQSERRQLRHRQALPRPRGA